MRKFLILLMVVTSLSVFGQRKYNIVKIIDELRYQWDETAISLKDYQGIQNFCAMSDFRKETIELLDEIHHWDTTLYFIVQNKYSENKDEEAMATLRDIETLETEYSTQNFKYFIQNECSMINKIEETFDSKTRKKYEKEIKEFEKELVKYLNSITFRVDIIDDHIHHLHLE